METIRQRSVLQAVLLLTLADHPDGLSPESVYDMIDQRYRFPDEWYRQIPRVAASSEEIRGHGYTDWREVPQELLIELVATEPQWQNEIRWARNDLRKLGYLDMTAPRGTWKLSGAGRSVAPTIATEGLSQEEQQILKSRRKTRPTASQRTAAAPPSGGGLRAELLAKMELLTASMPLEDLQLVVEITRAIRKRSLPESISD